MTNYEKFREIFGETAGEVKCSPSWLAMEYKGPVVLTERNKFITWLNTLRFVKYEIAKNNCIYITDRKGNAIMRVSDLDNPTIIDGKKCAFIRWDGLTGYKAIDDIKEIITRHESEAFDGMLDWDSLYNEIFGGRNR